MAVFMLHRLLEFLPCIFAFRFICLLFSASLNNRKAADKLSDGRNGIAVVGYKEYVIEND